MPVPADEVAASAMAEVFPAASPATWAGREAGSRRDGLDLPSLATIGATVPEPADTAWPRPADVPVLQADRLRELEEAR